MAPPTPKDLELVADKQRLQRPEDNKMYPARYHFSGVIYSLTTMLKEPIESEYYRQLQTWELPMCMSCKASSTRRLPLLNYSNGLACTAHLLT